METPSAKGNQPTKFITEANLYRLIMRSKLPTAEEFQDWVCGEVLPSIRKHGAYLTTDVLECVFAYPETFARLALQVRRQQLEEQAEEDKPKVVFANAVVGSKTSILVGELAKMLRLNGVDIGQNRLYEWLRQHHYLGSRGERYNLPNQWYIEQGLFELKQNVFSVNGEMRTRNTTKITSKGQQYFISLFLSGKAGL